jgi:hypothetical protein
MNSFYPGNSPRASEPEAIPWPQADFAVDRETVSVRLPGRPRAVLRQIGGGT